MIESVISTSAEDVVALFAGSARADAALQGWMDRRDGRHVVEHVMAHRTRAVYGLTVEDVLDVSRRTDHALGDVVKRSVEGVGLIRDWRPDFALTHVFHHVLEATGALFTYQQLQHVAKHDPVTDRMLTAPARAQVARAEQQGCSEKVARDAMRWRIGNAYYSFIREMYVVAVLRGEGIDARVHPLADALFRVDAWAGRAVLSQYISNARYRDGAVGRKTAAEELLGEHQPPFTFIPIPLPVPSTFGRVSLPDLADLARVVRAIRESS